MPHALRSFLLLLGTLSSAAALAQTPNLEFAPGAGNTTASGPSVANQVITFQNNATNPTDNTMTAYAPAVTATFSLGNQQYSNANMSTNTGVAFGATINTGGGAAVANAFFPAIKTIGASVVGNYTSASGVTGGIDLTANSGMELFTSVEPLPTNVPANQRYQFADLTITFSQALVNPVVHVTGLGGSFTPANGTKMGFTTELDLQTSGVTLSKLSGSTELSVNNTQILNSATAPDGPTGQGAASGSVLATTGSAGVKTLVFRLYLRPAAAGGTIHTTDNSLHSGDAWIISVSEKTASATAAAAPLPVQLAAFAAQAVAGRDAQLSWTTASELHNAYFDVERSLDGTTFAKIGQLAGQGSKATSTSYSYLDAGVGQRTGGLVYYRLRQVDTDGASAYSPVRTVSFGGASVAATASLYPNPAQASTSLDLSALPATATYQVRVLAATGAQLLTLQVAGGQAQALDLASLAPGLYTVLVTGSQAEGAAFRQVLRLNKQ